MILTKEIFDLLPHGKTFKTVTTTLQSVHNPLVEELTFVCKKGQGNDWAIYCHYSYHAQSYIEANGDKVFSEQNIRSVCPCSDEVFQLYRY